MNLKSFFFNGATATGGGGGGGGTSYVTVANFAALPAAGSYTGEVYLCLASQGVYFINRKPAGLYRSNGITWSYLAEATESYFSDNNLEFYDDGDSTKILKLQLSSISTGTTRTLTAPNANGTIALTSDITGTNSGTNTGDQSLFGTIAVSGQSDVVADSTSDTLTLVAGTNVTITTNAGADSVTISASGGGTPAWGSITGTLSSQTDLQSALDAKASASGLSTHIADTANPHSVTKTQVGLSNVDNTSDAGKPVSTAQATADGVVQAYAIQRANHTGTQLLATISDAGSLASQSGTFSGTSSGTNTGDQNLFGTISVSGQSDVVADSTSDTLTLVAGANVTITTNAGTDTITIAASGGGGGAGDWGTIGGTLSDQTDLQSALDAKASASGLSTHIADTANPHSVTKTQVGLSNVDNTSDAGKPVSTAQATADGVVQAYAIQRANHTGTQLLATISDAGTLASQNGTFSGTSSGTNTGDQTITLTGNVTGSGTGSFAATIANDAVTYAKMQNVSATDRLLGRSTSGAGDVEEIPCTAAGRALLDDANNTAQRTTLGLGTLATQSGTFSGTSSGTNTGDQTITLTGNVTGSGTGSFAATIANDAVTYAKIQNVSATDKLLGRSTAGSGDVEEITCTAAGRALIDDADASAQRTTLGLAIGTNVQAYNAELPIQSLTFVIDGAGSAITTGIKGDLEIPFACTIQRVTALADQSGSIVVDIWKDNYSNFPPIDADSITASAPVTISATTKSQDSTLTGWTTSVAAGDILRFNVDSVTSVQRLTISLKVTK